MKFKYYLRGAGVGLIVAAVILMIAFSKHNIKLTDDDIIKRAEELGMVMADDIDNGSKEQDENNPEDDTPDNENLGEELPDDETPDDNNDDANDDNNEPDKEVSFQIRDGEFSDVISNHLFELGLIDDPVKFNDWLIQHRYDGELCTGTFMIPVNSSYEEIVAILMNNNN